MEKRIEKVFINTEKKPDAIIIKNSSEPYIDPNFFYITGLQKGLFEGSIAVVFPDGNIDLIVSQLEEESTKKADANIKTYDKSEEYEELLKESLNNISCVGLNFNNLLHTSFCKLKEKFPDINFYDVSNAFQKTRMIKDNMEINLLKDAGRIADRVMEKIPDVVHEDMHEYELAAEINYLMQKNGADCPAFETISSFGKNTAEPHYSHGDTQLKNGDFVLCDFGARYKRYNSDITRTFIFRQADDQKKKMYDVVLEAQREGLRKIRAGVKASEVHNAVSTFIDGSEFKGCFIHSTGHSLGLEVHDPGVGFRENCDVVLQENMVLTVEPGVYIPGVGGVRIEDDVVVTRNGFEFLTNSKRMFIEI